MTETPAPPARERNTVSVHSLVTPSTAEAFEAWAAYRGLKTSAAVRGLIVHALWREVSGSPLEALPGDLPAEMARQIVTDLEARRTAPKA